MPVPTPDPYRPPKPVAPKPKPKPKPAAPKPAAPKPKPKPKPKPRPAPVVQAPRMPSPQEQATSWYQAALGALPTPQSITDRGTAQEAWVGSLASGLADRLRGSQVSIANTAGQGANVIQQLAAQAGNPVQGAVAAAGGGAVAPPTAAQNFASLIGANAANAMLGLEGSAIARGNMDQQQVRRDTMDRLDARNQAASGLAADREDRLREAMLQAWDQEFQRDQFDFQKSSALDQSKLAWATFGTDSANALAEQALKRAGLEQDAAAAAAKLAQDRAQFDATMGFKRDSQASLDAYRKAQIENAKRRIDAQIAGSGSDPKKRRDTITREANRLAQALRKQMTTSGGGSTTRPTGKTKYTYTVSWVDQYGEPQTKSETVTAGSFEEAEDKIRDIYAGRERVNLTQTGEQPITEKVPGSKTSSRTYTEDQVRGQVYNLFRSYGYPAAVAGQMARQIVPGGKKPKPRRGPPVQADAGDR